MEIILTAEQWADLKKIVALGAHAERRTDLPIEVINGDIKVEISETETKINLIDGE